jgi:glutathione S-transferase
MSDTTLVIGSKQFSSWSLRAWLFLRHHGVPFREVLVPLYAADTRAHILAYSPSGKVPLLEIGGLRVWESLAICEFAAERFALPGAWPADPAARAMARSIAAEMHAGFAELRKELPFEANRKPAPKVIGEAATTDVARVLAIWREARRLYGASGPWLFGVFGIADAMFAPVAIRFQFYAVPLDRPEAEYVQAVLAHPALREWLAGAALEAW